MSDRARVVVAGGGVAAIEAVLALHALAGQHARIALLTPARELVYRPLSVVEPFGRGRAPAVPLRRLLRGVDVEHLRDGLGQVRAGDRRVLTTGGLDLAFEALLVATGARGEPAIAGALTFGDASGVAAYRALLADVELRRVRRVVFAAPDARAWTLPLYELAVLTALHLFERRVSGVELRFVTAELAPLAAFGPAATRRAAILLERYGIELETGGQAGDGAEDERIVTLPRLRGPRVPGLPADPDGFLEIDEHARVIGTQHVYAAGDVTAGPLKQGGLATQQADAAAAAIAAACGAPHRPEPLHPVLRGLMITGESPVFLRAEGPAPHHRHSLAGDGPLWWPPAKVAGRYLSPRLIELIGC